MLFHQLLLGLGDKVETGGVGLRLFVVAVENQRVLGKGGGDMGNGGIDGNHQSGVADNRHDVQQLPRADDLGVGNVQPADQGGFADQDDRIARFMKPRGNRGNLFVGKMAEKLAAERVDHRIGRLRKLGGR